MNVTKTDAQTKTVFLRVGRAKATGMDCSWDTYFQCEAYRATHQIRLHTNEYTGCLRYTPPAWELLPAFHDRVKPYIKKSR